MHDEAGSNEGPCDDLLRQGIIYARQQEPQFMTGSVYVSLLRIAIMVIRERK